jgi:peptidoglycan-N-acetylmuramic acid deacetylase
MGRRNLLAGAAAGSAVPGATPPRHVALTFDTEHPDGPAHRGGGLDRLLVTLEDARVPATFFVQGRWATSEPDLVCQMAEQGHVVGNHSHDHVPFDTLSDDQIKHQLDRAHQALTRILGHEPTKWFRLPFHAGVNDPRVISAVRQAGYREVFKTVAPRDWDPAMTGTELVTNSVRATSTRQVEIVNLHSWPRATADALPRIIEQYFALGASFVAVDRIPIDFLERLCPGSQFAPSEELRPTRRFARRRPSRSS